MIGVAAVVVAIAAASMLAIKPRPPAGADAGMTHTVSRGDLVVSVIEQGILESSNNTEIKCKVRGFSTVTWVIDSGTVVAPGDVLVTLDTKVIEETVSLTKTNVDLAKAKLARSTADYNRAQIAIGSYLKGEYRSQMDALERDRKIAEENLRSARKMLEQSRDLFKRGYVTDLELEGYTLTVKQAELELEVKQTQIDVLEKYTKEMRLETLQGSLRAARSKKAADEAELAMTTKQRARALEELEGCVIKAERSGLVIYPSAAVWKETPDIRKGATVRKDQVLLLMPDLSRMHVKLGVHESVVDRVRPGLSARVTLPDRTIEAEVSSVSAVARPAGWWNGNAVKYDTIVELPELEGLKPGMSAEVEVILARYEDVVIIPVASVVETPVGDLAWVRTREGVERRVLKLGDTNDRFVIVEDGLAEGDEVVLDPLVRVPEAQRAVLESTRRTGNAQRGEAEHGE